MNYLFFETLISFREGKEVPGNRGYKYFGAARDLPGVRELFETEAVGNAKKTRAELMKVSDKKGTFNMLGRKAELIKVIKQVVISNLFRILPTFVKVVDKMFHVHNISGRLCEDSCKYG